MNSGSHIAARSCFPRKYGQAMLYVVALLLCLFLTPHMARAGKEEEAYAETSVYLQVQGIGGREIPAAIVDQTAYLSVTDVFDFLKIRNMLSKDGDTVTGFFISEQAPFLIDKSHKRIVYKGQVYELKEADLTNTDGGIFLRKELFESVFGLDCTFNFRGLSVTMHSSQELPAIREMRQELMRKNINRLYGQLRADTSIGRSYPFFRLSMADWTVIATQRINGLNDTRLNLTLGGMVAGGETIVALNYNNYARRQVPSDNNAIRPFDERNQYYRWRYVNNNSRVLRQAVVGKLFTNSISSIFDPVVGIQLTNSPTHQRRSFGTYTIANYTEPGWTVELYVNNELISYTKADASGLYRFEVPMIYGNSIVRLRFYGPWGEERSRQQHICIPFNFLPKHEFEYTVSAGIVEDKQRSRLGRVVCNYGLNRFLTIGGGVEYLSSVVAGATMPFVNMALRLTPNLLFSGDYVYGVRSRGMLTYRRPDNLQVDMYYTRYQPGQTAIVYNYSEERKLVVSRPFCTRNFSLFARLTLNQTIMPQTRYTNAECLLSGSVRGVNTNVSTYAVFMQHGDPYIYTNAALTFRLPGRTTITPQVQYGYSESRVIAARCEIGKYLFKKGYVDVSGQRNFKSDINSIGIGFRYDLSFSRISVSAWQTDHVTTLVQSASGSLVYAPQANYIDATNTIGVGTGGILLIPFLDLNNNGVKNKGEPRVSGLQASVNGGQVIEDTRDTSIRILRLEPYTSCLIDMSRSNFNNFFWRARQKTMQVTVDPNTIRRIAVPVIITGDASGTVYQAEDGRETPIGRITMMLYRDDSVLVGQMLSEADGYFSFSAIPPGNYTVRPDTAQLTKLGLTSSPLNKPFRITQQMDGDIIDDLKFVLRKRED